MAAACLLRRPPSHPLMSLMMLMLALHSVHLGGVGSSTGASVVDTSVPQPDPWQPLDVDAMGDAGVREDAPGRSAAPQSSDERRDASVRKALGGQATPGLGRKAIGPFHLGRFTVVVPEPGQPLAWSSDGEGGSAGVVDVRAADRSVLNVVGVAFEAGVWLTNGEEKEGMLPLDPGPVLCTCPNTRVVGASQPDPNGSVVLTGLLSRCDGKGCAGVAPAGGDVSFTIELSVAPESSATVAVAVRVGPRSTVPNVSPNSRLHQHGLGSSRARVETQHVVAPPHIPPASSDTPSTSSAFNSWRRLRISLAADANEKVRGLGVQYSYTDFKGRVVPIVTSEQGVGRGLEPLSTFLGDSAGNWHTTYSAIPQFSTSSMRGVYLEGTDIAVFDFTRGNETQVTSQRTILLFSTSHSTTFLFVTEPTRSQSACVYGYSLTLSLTHSLQHLSTKSLT
jgi:hypothetical protein